MSEPIRILNVVGRMDRGGIETLIMNIYRHIDRNKVQFDFLAHYGKDNADYNEEIRVLGGRIYEMPVIKSTEKTYYTKVFEYIKALKDFFRSHPEYHIVHGHMTNTASIYMPIAKKYGRVSCCIAHSHLSSTQKSISPLQAIGTNLLRIPLRNVATDYFACSESAARWLFSEKDILNGRVRMVQNGIDSALFDFQLPIRERLRKELDLRDSIVIGHVGRFYHPKNHDFIIDVFKRFHECHTDAMLMLVGEGELRTNIEKKVAKYGLTDNVIFMGMCPNVNELLQTMDLFLMPSHYEGLPVAGIEAQAAGLPVLASDAITREMDVTGNVCYLSLNYDVDRWAETIEKLLQGHLRISTRDEILKSGYDIQHTADELQEFYIKKHMDGKV